MISNIKLPKVLIVIVSLVLFSLITWKIISNFLTEAYSPGYCSVSVEESKKSNKFVRESKPIPGEFSADDRTIKIKECWIEERTRIKHDFVLFRRIEKIGGYYLCFTLEDSVPASKPGISYQFRREGSGYGFAKSKGIVYFDELASINIGKEEIRVALMRKESSEAKGVKIAEVTFYF